MLTNFYKNLWSITKPGIIFGNAITVTGGFFLGYRYYLGKVVSPAFLSQSHSGVWLFFMTLLGISLIIASGCVFNNYIDRDIDQIMQRTKNRALAQGLISGTVAICYACGLGLLGTLVLYLFTNLLTVILALIGLFVYVVVYSLWLKRNSIHATIIGSISGAMPPVVGYCAATNQFDIGAAILFLLLSIWQMPHSFAIAIYRFNDYANAAIPVLPVKRGAETAKIHMLVYVILFSIVSLLLPAFGYTSTIYLFVATIVAIFWVRLSIRGFKAKDNSKWARKMFGFSILAITALSICMAF